MRIVRRGKRDPYGKSGGRRERGLNRPRGGDDGNAEFVAGMGRQRILRYQLPGNLLRRLGVATIILTK